VKRHRLARWAIWIGCFVAVVFFMATFHMGRPAPREQSFSVTVGTGDFGKGHEGTLKFVLKGCDVNEKAVWCKLAVSSPKNDRALFVPQSGMVMTDKGGNAFRSFTKTSETPLASGRESTLSMGFLLDRKLLPPAKITLSGYVDNLPIWTSFEVR